MDLRDYPRCPRQLRCGPARAGRCPTALRLPFREGPSPHARESPGVRRHADACPIRDQLRLASRAPPLLPRTGPCRAQQASGARTRIRTVHGKKVWGGSERAHDGRWTASLDLRPPRHMDRVRLRRSPHPGARMVRGADRRASSAHRHRAALRDVPRPCRLPPLCKLRRDIPSPSGGATRLPGLWLLFPTTGNVVHTGTRSQFPLLEPGPCDQRGQGDPGRHISYTTRERRSCPGARSAERSELALYRSEGPWHPSTRHA
jgi:hypothetical protein